MNDAEFKKYIKKIKQEVFGPSPIPSGYKIEEYSVGAWCPTPDGSGKPIAVAITFKLKGSPHPMVLRLKSKGAVEMLKRLLDEYGTMVFGKDVT